MPDTICKKGTARDIIVYLLGQEPSKMYQLEEVKEKRSLSANGYYWALVEKIAKAMTLPKEKVHEQMLRDYGVWEYDSDGSPKWIVLPKNKPKPESVYLYDTGADVVVKGNKSGEEVGRAYIIIKGSHLYNSKEMSNLLKGVVQEAQNLEIETRTPQEIELMIQQMKEKE